MLYYSKLALIGQAVLEKMFENNGYIYVYIITGADNTMGSMFFIKNMNLNLITFVIYCKFNALNVTFELMHENFI